MRNLFAVSSNHDISVTFGCVELREIELSDRIITTARNKSTLRLFQVVVPYT